MEEDYFRNAWYQAAWSEELAPGTRLSRTLLGASVGIFRSGEGGVFALADACPHRFVPLTAGQFDGATVTCAYHGLAFDRAGKCVHNPQGAISDRASVRSYPAEERQGRIWLWFGNPEKPEPDLIPTIAAVDDVPASARGHSTMHVRCGWRLIIDNLLDLSHADFVHPSFGDFVSQAEMTVRDRERGLTVRWEARDIVTPGIYRGLVPTERADTWVQSEWVLPSTVVVQAGAAPVGQQVDQPLYSLHTVTPETTTTSHYFFELSRGFDFDNAELTDYLVASAIGAFEQEDKWVLEAQQTRLGDLDPFALEPLVLVGDRAAVLARRKLGQAAR